MESIKNIINEWDPMNLLLHAPDDEYEYEIEQINKILISIKEPYMLANEIKTIFFKTFGDNFNKTYENCLEIAKKVLEKKARK